MSSGRLAFAAFCLSLCGLGCSAEQPAPANPALQAYLHQTLTGHTEVAWAVAFSPDGQYLACCSPDQTVKLWRWPEGALAQTLAQPGGATSVAFSPDGQWLASGSYDQTVRLWRVADGALARTLSGHEGTVWSVAFSPDGRWLASSGYDQTVKVWRLEVSQPPAP